MLQPKIIELHSNFIGRESELAKLAQIGGAADEASIVVVYGRRRVGKTELLEQAFRERNILKFEGIENASPEEQMDNVLWQLGLYQQNPPATKPTATRWREVFKLIADEISTGKWTLYFEEVQWLASYEDTFIAELKYVWDNFLRYNRELVMVLCGSSPSFIINHVLQSKSLYNRSQYEIPLQELNLVEAKSMLGERSNREVMDAYLSVGGIPEYLKRLKQESSIFLGLCQNSFTKGGYFSHEADRIFASSMAHKKYYKQIIEYLSKVKFAARSEILKHLGLKSSGKFSELLKDLELCGFINKYAPYNLSEDGTLTRYAINDMYLQFYYKFIKPRIEEIKNGDYDDNPLAAFKTNVYYQWLGYAFERMCRKNHRLIAKILGFGGVNYRSGVYFDRVTNSGEPGFQIDLLFMRDDNVCTLCEIKYLQNKVGTSVIDEVEKKIERLALSNRYSLHKVLITTEGAEQALINRPYFDQVITLDDFFNPNNW